MLVNALLVLSRQPSPDTRRRSLSEAVRALPPTAGEFPSRPKFSEISRFRSDSGTDRTVRPSIDLPATKAIAGNPPSFYGGRRLPAPDHASVPNAKRPKTPPSGSLVRPRRQNIREDAGTDPTSSHACHAPDKTVGVPQTTTACAALRPAPRSQACRAARTYSSCRLPRRADRTD